MEVDATVRQDGSATVRFRISQLNAQGHEHIRKRIQAPSVKLISAALENGTGIYEVSVRNTVALRTVPVLRKVSIKHQEEEGHSTLELAIPQRPRTANKEPRESDVTIRITLNLPGPVIETNGTKTADSKVVWQATRADLLGHGQLPLTVTYNNQ